MDELSPPFASCLSFRIAHPLSAALNILVVDDHPVNRQVCALMLRELGCVAEYAACGGEALEMIAAKGYDLILMDCIMPGMDGLAASRIIRELEARGGYEQRALIVAYTANAIPGERERCLKAGMDDFLAKPVTPSQLARVIVEAARNRNALKTARALESAEGKPVLDPARMEQLCVEIDREVVMEMVRMFLDQFPGQCDACRGNLENARFAELIRNAHLIRGTAASLGAAALEQSAASLENAAALRNRTRLFREFERLMAAGEETCKALEAWLAESVIS